MNEALITINGYLYFKTDATSSEGAEETFRIACEKAGINTDNATIKCEAIRDRDGNDIEEDDNWIRIKGFRYYNDNYTKPFYKEFESAASFISWVKDTCQGKSTLQFPAANDDGGADRRFARSFSSHLRFRDETNLVMDDGIMHICTMTGPDGILFTSGDYTDGEMHIGKKAKEIFAELAEWKDRPASEDFAA